MEPGQHPDPLEEAFSAASQRVAQIASLAAAGAQVYMQRRALREARQAADDEHAARLLREHDRLATQQARLTWMPSHDPHWLAQADLEQTGRAWVGAAAYADTEPTAASAMRKSEDRLRQLHPYAMTRYDRLRADGAEPFDAMRQAAPLFARSPRTRTGQPAPVRLALPTRASASDDHHPTDSQEPDGPTEPTSGSDPRQQAERRGQYIAEQLQDHARAAGRAPLGPDELTTVLETITNLPDEVITAIARQASGAEPADVPSAATPAITPANGDKPLPGVTTDPSVTSLISKALPADPAGRSPTQLAADSFPHTAADAIHAVATRKPHPVDGPGPLSTTHLASRPASSL